MSMEFIAVQEAAKIMKIHPESVRRLARQGQLPFTRQGNKMMFNRAALEQLASGYDPRRGNMADRRWKSN